ncbi:MAG: Terminase-like family protein [Methanomassiliicoccales archaeon PtaU1.Bin030]|nr:MAG: Terminase-like family protein [Methanomassiliicoccales archaeon PtaU1.Bin030]
MPPHLKLLDKALTNIAYGIWDRLIVEMPPRHGKSELVSRYFPAWYLMHWPDKRIILTSYEADFAAQWGRKARSLLEEHGGKVQVSKGSSAADRWEIEGHMGGMQTAGIRGPITGKGADLLIIDDPVKNDEEARSELMRERNWDWYTSTARTRLEPDGAVVVIMTRWHEDDLVGRLLADIEGDKWNVIRLPAIAEPDDPLGRIEGQALWPERFDENALEAIRKGMSPYYWNALYQQSPTARGGNVIKDEWWRYYDMHAVEPSFLKGARFVIQAWDTAFKTGQDNDFSVCTTWAEMTSGAYLLSMWRGRVEFPELVKTSNNLIDTWKPNAVIIEDKASGQSLAQELQRTARVPIIPMPVDKDKVARCYAVTPEIEGGRVFLPRDLPGLRELLAETAAFPNGVHDDIVDSIVLGLSYIVQKRNSISRIVAKPSAAYRNPYAPR